MNAKSLFLLPAALALGAPTQANAYVGFRLNLAVPLYYPSAGYYYPEPVYTQNAVYQPAATQVVGEQVTPAPGPGYLWMAGHWNNVAQRWVWVPGHWELPPSPSATWVAGHWVQGIAGWVWVDGTWTVGGPSAQPQTPPEPPSAPANPIPQAPSGPPPAPPAAASVMPAPGTPMPPAPDMADGTVVAYEPPAPIVETIPVCPYPDYMWIGGYWGWSGIGWYWHGGHYGRVPYRGAAWVGGGWARSGGRWAWHGGRWH